MLNFINIDSLLNEEQILLRATIRKFVHKHYMPHIRGYFQEEKFPYDLIPKLGELGVLGPQLEGYGGLGLDALSYGLIMQELEAADSGLRSFASVQGSLCMWPIWSFGSEEQKQKFLPTMTEGKLIGCFGLTEADHGSDPSSMKTTAKKVAGGYVINGSKMWITNGCISDVAIIWAKLEGEIRGFLIEKNFEGFETSLIHGKFSLRASVTSALFFHDCFVPEENILPKAHSLKAPLQCLNQARFGIAWGVLGAAHAVYEEALKYAKERTVFGKPLASKQLIQEKLAYMVCEISKAQVLMLHLSKLKMKNELKHFQISMAKMNNVSMALNCARMARDILGANGISDEYCIIRHMLNLEAVNTYEGTEDIHRLIIGKEVTELSAF